MIADTEKPATQPVSEQDSRLEPALPYPDCPSAITDAGPAACAAWAQFTVEEGFRPSTQLVYRRTAWKFLRWLEAERIALADVVRLDVERFLDGQPVSISSKITYRTAIRRFFDVLLDHELVSTNPADQAKRGSDKPLGSPPADSEEALVSEDWNVDQPPTLAEMKAIIRELDPPTMDDDLEMLDAGIVLLAGLHLGTRQLIPISRFTGVSPSRVAKFAKRLRANGVWTQDGKTAGGWHDPETGGLALLVDILVATGMLERRDQPDDKEEEPSSEAHKTAPDRCPGRGP